VQYLTNEDIALLKVAQQGFEPQQTEPKTGVLPLHHWAIYY
jgi:hypothetical protein